MANLMGPRGGVASEVVALVVWWSVWTLFDQYLIPFSPVPEVVMLCACALYSVYTWAGPSVHRQKVTLLLDGITQTSVDKV